jgi:hypothetical protein
MFYRPPRNFYLNQKYVRIILEGVKEKSKLFNEGTNIASVLQIKKFITGSGKIKQA